MTTVKIDGVDYPLQIDTGSSDLWVNTTKLPTTLVRIPTFAPDNSIPYFPSFLPSTPNDTSRNISLLILLQTDIPYNLTYGSGYAYGHIGRAPVSFAG